MTLLFAFFTTLYAMSKVDKQKADALAGSIRSAWKDEHGASPPPTVRPPGGEVPDQKRIDDLLEPIERAAKDISVLPELAGRVRVHRERGGVVLSLSEAGFFESGKASLHPGAQSALDLFAKKIANQTDTDIVVEGHTDNVPVSNERFHSNWELSTVRATFVVSMFLKLPGFDPARIGAAGYADNRPIADNATKEGRARNRRVDVVLRPSLAGVASSAPTPPATKLATSGSH
jgi:chemotaxis protein MotB